MATPSSPFSFLDDMFDRVGEGACSRRPGWCTRSSTARCCSSTTCCSRSPRRRQRLARQRGPVVEFDWRFVACAGGHAGRPAATWRPGLVDGSDLTLRVTEESPCEPGAGARFSRRQAARCASTATCSSRPRSTGWSTTCAGTSRTTWRALIGDVPAREIAASATRSPRRSAMREVAAAASSGEAAARRPGPEPPPE